MTMFNILFLLSLALVCTGDKDGCDAEQNDRWSYHGKNGPYSWKEQFQQCGGSSQSPINIKRWATKHDDHLSSLKFINYDAILESARIENNGHTVQVTPTDGVNRMIKHGGLSQEYSLQQLHFHWGKEGHGGSEHTVDGHQYDMEAHLVHTGANNSIAVVAIFMKKRWFLQRWKNEKLEPIIQSLRDVGYKNENSTLQSDRFKLLDLLPHHANCFYRYSGSLTTPGCTEGVIWSVLKAPVSIGYEQIKEFWNLNSTERSLPSNQQCSLQKNYRPIQDLNRRQVSSTHC